MSWGVKLFWIIIIAMIIAVNPPVLNWVSDYSKNNLLTLGFPTFWLWLEFWYSLAALSFLIGALKIDKWKKEEDIEIEESQFEEEGKSND